MALSIADYTKKLLQLIKKDDYYAVGDTINGRWEGAGFVTNSGNRMYLTLTLPKRVPAGATLKLDAFKVIARQSNKYCYGSSASSMVAMSSGYANLASAGWVSIMAQMDNTTNVTNNSPIGISANITIQVVSA